MRPPTVPEKFRSYEPPTGWANVFPLAAKSTFPVDHLYGTEPVDPADFGGQWDGETLLLARDTCPAWAVRRDVEKGVDPWRPAVSGGGSKTNKWLGEHCSHIPGGKLYGSACAHLLVETEAKSYSTALRGFRQVEGHLIETLRWVVGVMPKVRRIVTLGSTAWHVSCLAAGKPDAVRDHTTHRDSASNNWIDGQVGEKTIRIFAVFHPAARVSHARKEACWSFMLNDIARW